MLSKFEYKTITCLIGTVFHFIGKFYNTVEFLKAYLMVIFFVSFTIQKSHFFLVNKLSLKQYLRNFSYQFAGEKIGNVLQI